MTQALKLFATYNSATNEQVATLLSQLGPAAYTQERNTHFKSLHALHFHLLTSTRFLQCLVRTNSENKYLVSPLTEESYELKAETSEEVCLLQAQYDKNFLAFTEALDEKDVTHLKTKMVINRRTFVMSLSDILTQYIVHTVHHRGQFSQLLDEMGIEHDIGGVWVFTKELQTQGGSYAG